MRQFVSFIAAAIVAVSSFAQSGTERILLPIFSPPVHGAHNSEFITEFHALNDSGTTITLEGVEEPCPFTCIPATPGRYELKPEEQIGPGDLALTGNPGRFIVVDSDQLHSLWMNLRVRDVVQGGSNYGAEIPIVRESDFIINRINFIGVPTDSRFRNTLRIYSTGTIPVLVTVGNRPPVRVVLNKTADLYSPAYALFNDLPVDAGPLRVTIDADPDFVSLLPIEIPLWAFITVTNNSTNVITTITPQQ